MIGTCDACGRPDVELVFSLVGGMESYSCFEGCDNHETPEPCTTVANAMGCTCHVPPASPTAIDPPEPRIDKACPLHGAIRDCDEIPEEPNRDFDWWEAEA